MADSTEKKWGALSHVIPLIFSPTGLGGIASLVLLLTKGRDSHFVRFHCLQAMIFQILLFIGAIVGFMLKAVIIGYPLLWILGIVGLVFPILGAIRAYEGREYGLPIAGHIARSIRGS